MVRAGSAVVEASDGVVAAGRTMAAHLLEAAAGDIEYRNGAFRVVGTDRAIGIFDLARAAAAGRLPPALGTTLGAATMHENPAFAFANGCEVCELEVDPRRRVEIVAAHDGRRLRPLREPDDRARPDARRGGPGIGQSADRAVRLRSASGSCSRARSSTRDPARRRSASISVTSRDVPSPTNALGVKAPARRHVGAPGAGSTRSSTRWRRSA